MGRHHRASEEWQGLYVRRVEMERLFSSLKRSLGLEGHRYRGMAKIRMLAALSMLSYSATLLSRVKVDVVGNWRWMRVKVA